MSTATSPRHVLFICGRSGVGLSWLTTRVSILLARRGVDALLLDTRNRGAPLHGGGSAGVVLVDAGPGINDAVLAFATRVTLVVLICSDDPLLGADSYGVLKACVQRGYRGPVVVISNKARHEPIGEALAERLAHTVRQFLRLEAVALGAIQLVPHCGHPRRSGGGQNLRGRSGRSLRRLTERLMVESAQTKQALWTQVAGLFV